MRLRFEDFYIDLHRRELIQAELPVVLSPKAFDLLVLLLEHSPKVLLASDACATLWPDAVIDTSRINDLAREIREAIGDTSHRMVRTVYGRGYTFTAPVVPLREFPVSECRLVVGQQMHDLPMGESIIGRDARATIRVDMSTISRRHACIAIDAERARITDLASHNGTFVNGQRIQATELNDGDEITFGSVKMKFVRA